MIIVEPNDAACSCSIIKPQGFPNGTNRFYLLPVEYPKDVYEKLILAPAFYTAHCATQHKYNYRGGMKLCLGWGFFLSGCEGLILPQNINLPKVMKPSTLYFKQWVLCNQGRRPRSCNLTYMTPKIFLQKQAIVCVRPARPKFPDGSLMPESHFNPVVGYIKELIDEKEFINH